MVKKIISTVIAVYMFFTLFLPNAPATAASPTPFPTSYELFYPVVAGKTAADKFYFLKIVREWIAGRLISDPIRKADFHLVLSEKRLVEAEKLFIDQSLTLAEKTITKAVKEIKLSYDIAKKAESQGKKTVDILYTIRMMGNKEADFIDFTLIPNTPSSEKEFLTNTSKSIRDLIR